MTSRKDFLVAGTIAAAALPRAALADAPAAAPSKPPALDFDLAAFTASLNTPQPHKHVFAACEINGGEVLSGIRNTLNAYRDVGTDWKDVYPVAVLYHGFSLLLALDDAFWAEYMDAFARGLAKKKHPGAAQIASVQKTGVRGNPCLREQGGDSDTSIRSLVADAGTRFFLCNNAAHGIASLIASTLGKKSDVVYADLTRHLVPNATLVPAGVWAVHAIEEQHFTLLHTSLAH